MMKCSFLLTLTLVITHNLLFGSQAATIISTKKVLDTKGNIWLIKKEIADGKSSYTGYNCTTKEAFSHEAGQTAEQQFATTTQDSFLVVNPGNGNTFLIDLYNNGTLPSTQSSGAQESKAPAQVQSSSSTFPAIVASITSLFSGNTQKPTQS